MEWDVRESALHSDELRKNGKARAGGGATHRLPRSRRDSDMVGVDVRVGTTRPELANARDSMLIVGVSVIDRGGLRRKAPDPALDRARPKDPGGQTPSGGADRAGCML